MAPGSAWMSRSRSSSRLSSRRSSHSRLAASAKPTQPRTAMRTPGDGSPPRGGPRGGGAAAAREVAEDAGGHRRADVLDDGRDLAVGADAGAQHGRVAAGVRVDVLEV